MRNMAGSLIGVDDVAQGMRALVNSDADLRIFHLPRTTQQKAQTVNWSALFVRSSRSEGGGLSDDARCLQGDHNGDRRKQQEGEREIECFGHCKSLSV